MLVLIIGGVFGLVHGVEAGVGVLPYAGPVLNFVLHIVTG
jgi:hypothetical protein